MDVIELYSGSTTDFGRSLVHSMGGNGRYERVEMPSSEIDVESADLVISLGNCLWVQPIREWTRIVANLLHPGGKLYVVDWHPDALETRGIRLIGGTKTKNGRRFGYTLDAVRAAMTEAGLEVVSLDEHFVDYDFLSAKFSMNAIKPMGPDPTASESVPS